MPLPTVKQLIDGLMVADWNAAATGAVEQAFASAFGVNLNSTASWGLAVAMGNAFGTGSFPPGVASSTFLNGINFNLTGSGMTIPGELSAFQTAAQQFGLGGAAGILVEAQFLTSSEVGLTAPGDVATWNTQSLTAQNRTTVSGNYANATPPNGAATALVPAAVGDAAWVASQTILLGVTDKVATVLGASVQIQAAANPPPGDPTKITPLPLPGQTFTLTTGQDTVPPAGTTLGNNNTVNGIGGGPTGAAVGSTFTPNDSINFGTTTGNIFNLQGIGPAGTWDVTSVAGAKVAGIQTVNIASNTLFGALSSQSVTGDFTATGPEGDWTGLTLLAVSSGSGILGGVDNLTVGPATAVQVTDSLLGPTATPMTINGGSTVTITENNTLGFGNAGITVNGGTGTTSVSITQTEIPFSATDGVVLIQDAGFAAAAAGTIKTVVLDELDSPNTAGSFPIGPPDPTWTYAATINDNALANLTVKDAGLTFNGTSVLITDNLATPTATTLNLSLNNDGNFAPSFFGGVTIVDANNEISTLHLTLGDQASTLTFSGQWPNDGGHSHSRDWERGQGDFQCRIR